MIGILSHVDGEEILAPLRVADPSGLHDSLFVKGMVLPNFGVGEGNIGIEGTIIPGISAPDAEVSSTKDICSNEAGTIMTGAEALEPELIPNILGLDTGGS